MILDRLDPFEEESFASFMGMMFEMLEILRKNLLFPLLLTGESFDDFVSNCGSLEIFLSFFKEKKKRRFFFFNVHD